MGLWDLRVHWIAAPDQNEIGVEPVVARAGKGHLAAGDVGAGVMITDLRIDVEVRSVEQVCRPEQAGAMAAVGYGGAAVPVDGTRPLLFQDSKHVARDVAQRLVPAHPLPLAGATFSDAFERILQPVGIVHAQAVAPALLAAARVEVRDIGIGAGIGGRLFLAEHKAILYIDVPVAAALIPAVDVVGALGDLVPRPLLPEHVLPAAIVRQRGEASRRTTGAAGPRFSPRQTAQRQGKGHGTGGMEELSAGQAHGVSSPCL